MQVTRNRLLSILLVVLTLIIATSISAQEELSGELTISFWGNVDEYEAGLSDNRPWEATYNLIKEWDELHPNVTVTFISQPTDGIYDRVRTQLISGTLPDVVSIYPNDTFLEGNIDLVYDLTSHLAEKNPYGELDTWGEEFWYDLTLGLRSGAIPEGHVYFVGNALPSNIGQLVIFYNKTAFEEAGITEIPVTFAELISACDSLKEAGWTPLFADAAAGPTLGWYSGWIGEQLLAPVVTDMFDAWGRTELGNWIDEQMMMWAIDKGVLSGDNQYVLETARLMNEMQDHCWNEDWQASEGTVEYFLTKRVAMTHNGFWGLPQYIEDPARDFEFGSFVFPLITKESSDLATLEILRRYGGLEGGEIGNSLMIPMTTVENGKLPLALDLLQFVTARSGNAKWCETQFPPCIPKDQSVDEVITDPIVQDQVYGFYNPPMSPETSIRGIGNSDWTPDGSFIRLLNLYMTDSITLEDFGAQLQTEYQRLAEKAIIDHPDWDTAAWPEP